MRLFAVADSFFNPLERRQQVEHEWPALTREECGPTREGTPPLYSYFLDHYAHLLHLRDCCGIELDQSSHFYPCHLGTHSDPWGKRTLQFLNSCSFWDERSRPVLDAPVPDFGMAEELLGNWSGWLRSNGVRHSADHYVIPKGMTWGQLFAESVHFPERPAISGPTFFTRLSLQQQRDLIDRSGREAPIALYIALLRIHESSHFLQTGCPFLNELSLSGLWGAFLTEFDQWHWQSNEATGTAFNLEWEFTKHVPLHPSEWGCIFNDSFLGLEKLICHGAIALYGHLRRLALEVFQGQISYRTFTRRSCEMLIANLKSSPKSMRDRSDAAS